MKNIKLFQQPQTNMMKNSPEMKIVLNILDDAIENNDMDKVKGARKILYDIDRLNYIKSINYHKKP